MKIRCILCHLTACHLGWRDTRCPTGSMRGSAGVASAWPQAWSCFPRLSWRLPKAPAAAAGPPAAPPEGTPVRRKESPVACSVSSYKCRCSPPSPSPGCETLQCPLLRVETSSQSYTPIDYCRAGEMSAARRSPADSATAPLGAGERRAGRGARSSQRVAANHNTERMHYKWAISENRLL